jgi:hypothetical protein
MRRIYMTARNMMRKTATGKGSMADQLYLSLWYPNFRTEALAPAILGVLRQFALIGSAPGDTALIHAATVYPIDWTETPVYNRIYEEDEAAAAAPVQAVPEALDPLHEDFAYEFEVAWPLWQPEAEGGLDLVWRDVPSLMRVTGFGPEFDDRVYVTQGQVRLAFGLDTPFLQEEVELDSITAGKVKENIARLLALVHAIEKNCGISSRLLWSESGESLAEKLVARLEQVN